MAIIIQFRWQDLTTGAMQQMELAPPIAIGKELSGLPTLMGGCGVSPLVLDDGSVSRYHACISYSNDRPSDRPSVVDQGSTNGILVNGVRVSRAELANGDLLQVGRFSLRLAFALPTIVPTNLDREVLTLSWADPKTGQTHQQTCPLPVAIGRESARMPTDATPIILDSLQVSRYHALISQAGQGQTVLVDQKSTTGTFVNGKSIDQVVLKANDVIKIGGYQLLVGIVAPTSPTVVSADTENPVESGFPPPCFQSPVVSVQDIFATRLPVIEANYGAIGAGLGSYIWADYLRIGGVSAKDIVAIGLEPQPYARYKRLCENSQIPAHERLRSNSDSCPDNIWGYPSYAWREAWQDLTKGKVNSALYYLWQVFAEPTCAETYTPRSGNVYDSIDREAKRIGWAQIYRYGRVRAIRKTNDGRYAIAYSMGRGQYGFLLCPYAHLAVGYGAIQFLPDLQDYRERTGDFQTVVNAYEDHEHIYQFLERSGGTVILRGRGIVASRIMQRLYEVRAKNANINVLHLMRSPKPSGNRYGRARRVVENHFEFQPFNWPKACWGGDLLALLASADASTRQQLLADWGGTTTAARRDWRKIIQTGLDHGWYRIAFGEVEQVEPTADNKTITTIQGKTIGEKTQLLANFIIDATGLDAKITANPLYADLVQTYSLPINFLGRLTVNNDFSIVGMENDRGKMYGAGAATLGGPHAAVDSFLGLQFACLAAVDSLQRHHALGLHKIDGLRSLLQWWKWATNSAP